MYTVYINNFKRNNAVVSTEETMFTIPSSNTFPVSKSIVKSSEDSADNFNFTMESSSPYYDSLMPLKTIIRVDYDGDIIFSGRVLTIATSSILHTKNVTCEGTFAYFNDTYYEGKQEKNRTKISVSDYYTRIINNHNTNAPAKKITKGTVGVTLPTDTDKYEPTAWTQTSSLISNLTSNYGGHMRVRYSGGTSYLDWYKYYVRDLGDNLRPKVKIGKNILDISSDLNVDNIFTRVIPIGDTDNQGKPIYVDGYVYTDKNGATHTYSGKSVPISIVRDLYTDQQLTDEFHNANDYSDAESLYGVIYKTMSFSDATTQAKLWDYMKKWIKESYFGVVQSFTVKAIDMHIISSTNPKILLGDCVDVTYSISIGGIITWVTKKLVCKAVQFDLFNPDNNSYTFGVPSDLLEHDRHNKKKSSSTNHTSSGASSSKVIPEGVEDGDLTWEKIFRLILDRYTGDAGYNADYDGHDAGWSFHDNGEMSGSAKCYDPDDPSNLVEARIVGKITLSGKSTKWVAVSGNRGIFAFIITTVGGKTVCKITHWYSQHKGYKYQGEDAGLSTFEKIAQMIEADTNSTYGGSTNATSFRNNGAISGSVKCYDPDETNSPSTHPECVFTAQIIGKFGSSGAIKYVASSDEYGVFAYTHSAFPDQVKHWYMKAKGVTYNNITGFITEESTGNIFTTDDKTPDGDKTILMKPEEILVDGSGNSSEGTVVIGYDLRSQTDKWKIHLNKAIVYSDAEGVTRVADGFVSASDINIPDVASLKTKLIVADEIIAGKVDAAEISAEMGYIHNISSQQISAGLYVTAGHLKGNYLELSNNASIDGNVNVIDSISGQYTNLCRAFNSVSMSESNGTVTITMGRTNGSTSATASFNMASTTFYQNAVGAAREGGWEACYADIGLNYTTNQNIDPGQTRTIYPACKPTESGQHASITSKGITVTANTDANLVAGNIKNGVTIFGVTGSYSGGSVSSSDIKIHDYGSVSTGTTAPSMAAGILQAIDRGSWFSFEVYIDGTSAKKTYSLDFR